MKPRILVDCERLKYPKSGLATVCRSLVHGLSKNSSLDFTFYGPRDALAVPTDQILDWKPWHKLFPPSTKKYELVHVTHQLSDYFHQVSSNQKKAVTLHDLNFLHENLSDEKILRRLALVQKNLGNADAIICISEFAKTDFVKNMDRFKLKKDVEITVVHNGLMFPDKSASVSQRFNYLRNKPYILNIGVLFPKKNQKVLLEFLAKTDLHLVLVSSDAKGDYEREFSTKVSALELQDRVHILKDVNETEKNFLLQNCESYVHPSLAEGFGIPPIEAMYFGKPVFLSTQTSLPEIGGDAAFYFQNFEPDSMLQAYRSGMDRFNKQKAANEHMFHEHAMRFGADKMAEQYAEIYLKLLAK